MRSQRIARRTGLLVSAGTTALMLVVALPTSASAAVGDVQVVLGEPGNEGPIIGAPRKLVQSPTDGHCYTVKEVFPEAPEGSYFRSVSNHTNTSVFIYEADACAGAPRDRTPMEPGKVIIGLPLRSFKIVPAPSLNPEDFKTSTPSAS
ncbi:hypothetical protein ACFWBC_13435 [Streptomyces sp. NPDC059985]|uniref:hypothetical protein n=1 Tax=Streptomyces sp. NPDC059985 TaxID=3347025 RepID=UPI0036C19671